METPTFIVDHLKGETVDLHVYGNLVQFTSRQFPWFFWILPAFLGPFTLGGTPQFVATMVTRPIRKYDW